MPKLSVIIPAYNAEKYIAQAIASVSAQKWMGEREYIVIDDGSTDQTLKTVQPFATTIIQQLHKGAAAARNAGLKQASGDFILFLDADDKMEENSLETLYCPFSEAPNVSAVFAEAKDFVSPELTPEQKDTFHPRQNAYGGVLPGCSLVKRCVFDEIGVFDETLMSGETVAWMLELRKSKLHSVFLSQVTLRRRLHMNNTGRVDRVGELRNYASILRKRINK